MKSVTVLLTGCGAPGAYGIIKCLKKNGERDIRIIGVDMNQDAGAKDMVDTFYTVPAAKDDDFINKILQICLIEKVNIILPIVTRELMKFALNKQIFEMNNIKVSVMDPEILRIVNNKANLLLAMKKGKNSDGKLISTDAEFLLHCAGLNVEKHDQVVPYVSVSYTHLDVYKRQEIGDPDNGIAAGTAFADLPEDWVCPLCGVGKDQFSKQ